MRDGELCRFSAVADDESKTIDRHGDAKTIDKDADAKTINRLSEQSERQARTLVRAPSEALLYSEREPKTRPDLAVHTEPDFGDVAYDPLGTLIDNRYFVEALIARGGMGVVYRCRHKSIGKQVAVKVLRKDVARLAEAPRRLLIEARAASAIGNEHIIDITDFGTLPDGSSYLVMELLDGLPLSELISSHGTLPLPRVLSIGKQLAEGLLAAHTAGIVHRDLKPENIFLLPRKSDDFVKILDFGIAKIAPTDSLPLTRAGAIVGTPDYMSPEQAAGLSIDHRVDIYSLGVILYELAAGRVPFYASNYMGLLTKIMTEPPPPFRALIPAPPVPPEFEGIVLRCLAKQPGGRFQSMQELLSALEQVELLIAPGAAVGSGELTPRAASVESGGRLPAPPRMPSEEQSCSPGSLSAVSGQQYAPASPRGARWGIHALGATLVLLFSLTWLSYLQRAQPPASASTHLIEAVALPPAPDTTLPEPPTSAPPPLVVPALEATPATPPAPPPALTAPEPSARKAAPPRKARTPRPAPQATPARLPERVPERVPPPPTPARSVPVAEGLMQPWSERP